MFRVSHATQAVGTDAGNGEIHKNEWNEDHAIDGAVPVTNGGTGETVGPVAVNKLEGFLDVTASATPVELTNESPRRVCVRGSAAQTIVLPATNTIDPGWTFVVINESTGVVTVQPAGGGAFTTQGLDISATYTFTDDGASGTDAWTQQFGTLKSFGDLTFDGGSF
jgi:hypothetical protein